MCSLFQEGPRWPGDLAASAPAEVMMTLTFEEAESLAQYEAVIERTLGSFLECSEALFAINQQRLYKTTHRTFDAYVRERWGISAKRAERMIRSVVVVADLKDGMDTRVSILPVSEFQTRPLAKLSSEERRKAWPLAVAKSGGEQPTARIVDEAAEEVIAQREPLPGQGDLFEENGKEAKEKNIDSSQGWSVLTNKIKDNITLLDRSIKRQGGIVVLAKEWPIRSRQVLVVHLEDLISFASDCIKHLKEITPDDQAMSSD